MRLMTLLIAILWSASALSSQQTSDPIKLAEGFVGLLRDGKFDEANRMLSKVMVEGLEKQGLTLRAIWTGLVAQLGEMKGIESGRVRKEAGYTCVYLRSRFKKGDLVDIKVVLDEEGKVAGLFFLPASEPGKYTPPDYADPDLFVEEERSVGQPGRPATLTLPRGEGPFPAVVLVHGSGPHDRDETVGANKPFKDLAWGLATKGIAVLRYEKRTKAYPREMARMAPKLTVEEEVIKDALAAVELLRKEGKIDPKAIFVLGHSLGAMLAPRIAAKGKGIAGIIMLAPNARSLPELMLEQTRYLLSLDGEIDSYEAEKLEELKEMAERIRKLEIKEGEIVLGASREYWRDLLAY
ncbi:hypothetical protein DRP77_12235, partial [Candidatus Poribacteria bacterium]